MTNFNVCSVNLATPSFKRARLALILCLSLKETIHKRHFSPAQSPSLIPSLHCRVFSAAFRTQHAFRNPITWISVLELSSSISLHHGLFRERHVDCLPRQDRQPSIIPSLDVVVLSAKLHHNLLHYLSFQSYAIFRITKPLHLFCITC